jgi:hypothetical protein
MIWTILHPEAIDMLGILPDFLNESDPRSAREQIGAKYIGGWHPLGRFEMLSTGKLKYPGDPPIDLIAEATFRDEIIRVYDCSWVAIIQPNGDFEVARIS